MTRLKTYGKRRSLRHPGLDYSLPYIYHVIVSVYNHGVIFTTDEMATILVDNLMNIASNLCYEIYAFCILPDHLHILCQPQAGAPPLQAFVGRVKGRVSRELGLRGIPRPLWQRGFFDHALRRDEDVWTVAKYIAENPVRGGLVVNYEDYPYSYIKGVKQYQVLSSSP